MAHKDDMTNFDLLHSYFDGGLDSRGQQQLFAALETNAELRKRFNEHVKIRRMMKHYAAGVSVPAVTTHRLFNTLGFAEKAEPARSGVLASLAAGSVGLLSGAARYKMLGLTGLASAAITALLLLNFDSGSEQARTSALPRMYSEAPEPQQPRAAEPVAQSTQAAALHTPAQTAPGVAQLPVAAPSGQSAEPAGHAPDPSAYKQLATAITQVIPLQGTPLTVAALNRSATAVRRAETSGPATSALIAPGAATANPRFTLEVQRFAASYSPDAEGLVPNADLDTEEAASPLDNTAITLLYALDDEHSIGLAYGRERFGQYFELKEASGRLLAYRQNPMLNWFGAVWHYNSTGLHIVDGLSPWAQINLAWAETGLLSRASLGLKYMPVERVSLSAGVHGGNLLYEGGSTIHNSLKWGMSYGVAVRLW